MVVAKKSRAVRRKPGGTGTEKKRVGRGRAKMKEAADKTLEANSDKIAKSLLKKTLAGNNVSAKLLITLAEGQIDCEDEAAVQHLCSLAEELASEPEWDGELDETEAESGLCQRERDC
jgi:hypothetical protein